MQRPLSHCALPVQASPKSFFGIASGTTTSGASSIVDVFASISPTPDLPAAHAPNNKTQIAAVECLIAANGIPEDEQV
jgi:hypothetical protein